MSNEPRGERIATSLTESEKRDFRVEAAKRDMDMSELLRELVYDFLEEEGHETSREATEGNPSEAASVSAD